jgi:ribulose 1,5-bisphosphate synthetase/thiazole synthase
MPPKNEPIWTATSHLPAYSVLLSDTTADVCVVGAGISGLTTAYLLTQLGFGEVINGPANKGLARA